jgi:hypothetical protein
MQMKMVFCCEVKHFNRARVRADMTRTGTREMHPNHDDSEFTLQHKDFEQK